MHFEQEIIYSKKALAVDDDAAILDILSQAARGRVDLTTASSAKEGIALLEEQGPFGVVMSDLRMPDVDGIQFLDLVRKRWPHTVRILFTGFADLQAATKAINTSQVFRLLTKPAHNKEILAALSDGLKQHRMIVADEAHLLERERQFRTALLDLPLPAMIHAEDGQLVLMNRAWREISGWATEDIPDFNAWRQKALDRDAEEVQKEFSEIYAIQGRVAHGEQTVITKQGARLVWDFSSASLGEMPDGRRAIISIASDVTQRRAMEESLSRAGQVFDNATNGILVTDYDGSSWT
ncbi:response regulator [Desulfoferula mesophila]